MENYKTCSKCKQQLPLDSFVIDKYKKDNRTSQCKECRYAVALASRQNPENQEKRKKAAKDYYDKNKDKAKQTYKKWLANNKDRRKAIDARYRSNNRIKQRERMAVYRKQNPEIRKNWAKQNPEKQKALYVLRHFRRRGNRVFFITTKEIQNLYLQSCLYCGSKDEIQIDHIIPVAKGGEHRIGNLAAACKSCNMSKKDKFLAEWRYESKNQKLDYGA